MSVTSPCERHTGDLGGEAAPVVDALDAVGTTWRVRVVYALATVDGERRFNELKRATGASSKTLSDALDVLDEHGVVERRVEADAPVAVYYSLTETGRRLVAALDAVGEWADRRLDGGG